MKRFAAILLLLCPSLFAQSSNALRVFFIDVEGGQATLFVPPHGDSLLIDTGWPGEGGRDADRIAATAKRAGLKRIDYVLLTHYHDDHTGGVPQLVDRIPVGTFIDHGPNREANDPVTKSRFESYEKVLATGKYKHIVATTGEKLPMEGLDVTVVSADGATLSRPLEGGGAPNPYCEQSEKRKEDQTENARSLGTVITFHGTRILDLGDLTWDKEVQLMCPNNRLGKIDVLIVSHHGWMQSSSPALVDAVSPRIAIMDNGEKKGGSKPTVQTLRKIPGLEALWQLHYSEEAGDDNAPAKFLANEQGQEKGNGIDLTVAQDGLLTVMNTRTKESVQYPKTGTAR